MDLWQQIAAYLPTLAAGLLVVALGLVAGWLAKRAMIRLLTWLRLDRLAGRAGWRTAFGKGDVRSALYNLIGNIAMIVIVLVFLDDALERLGLLALSRIIDSVVFYLPNLGLVALIVTFGLMASNALEARTAEVLEEEGVPRARLIGKAVKGMLVLAVVALSLWQLQLAREIVLAAFLIGFGSIGVAFAIGVGLGSFKAIQQGLAGLFRKKDDA
jgi:Mechanosensitive ion channel, conserved TM helix